MRVMKVEDLKVDETYWMITCGGVREVRFLREVNDDEFTLKYGWVRVAFDIGERYLRDYTRVGHNAIYTEEAEAREWVADEGYQESLAEWWRQLDEEDMYHDPYED